MEVDGVSDLDEATELIDTTAPGSLPFVDFAISDFAELVAATEQLQATGHWAVRTPAGPLVSSDMTNRQILRTFLDHGAFWS